MCDPLRTSWWRVRLNKFRFDEHHKHGDIGTQTVRCQHCGSTTKMICSPTYGRKRTRERERESEKIINIIHIFFPSSILCVFLVLLCARYLLNMATTHNCFEWNWDWKVEKGFPFLSLLRPNCVRSIYILYKIRRKQKCIFTIGRVNRDRVTETSEIDSIDECWMRRGGW